MGLFKSFRDVEKHRSEYRKASRNWLAGDDTPLSEFPGAPPGIDDMLRYRDLAQRIAASGVEAPAVLTAIERGPMLTGGAIRVTFEVTIAPAEGDPYAAVIVQPMMDAQLEDLSVGQPVTVRYDVDERTDALIYSW